MAERPAEAGPIGGPETLLTRCWQALGSTQYEDFALIGELEKAVRDAEGAVAAALHNALGVMLGRQSQGRSSAVAAAEVAVECFRRALDCQPGFLLAGVNLAEALAAAGQNLAAIEAARRVLELLQRHGPKEPEGWDGLPWGRSFEVFSVEWEHAPLGVTPGSLLPRPEPS